ncbi:MAG: tyrosine-protein phosphatase [Alphaproteobacteria bacterium]|nr:tyrosine-protein phosphatase [Alphaproteobacteria bacterium]
MVSAFELSTPIGRRRTYLDFVWNDHAYLRLAFQNAHWISDELVRTNQPWPHQLAAWKARGVRTIINLRGGSGASSQVIEEDACRRLGLKLITFRASSREPPSVDQVLRAKALFESIAYPALMHCKSGADRSGVMSVLYMHLRQGKPIREAIRQLHLRFLHWPGGRTGVLRFTFDTYLREAEPRGMSFLEWVQSPDYEPARIQAAYSSARRGPALDRVFGRE